MAISDETMEKAALAYAAERDRIVLSFAVFVFGIILRLTKDKK